MRVAMVCADLPVARPTTAQIHGDLQFTGGVSRFKDKLSPVW